ncbi:hypothetical protein [Mesoplasma melaleucae]|uniref:Uncharacterized protein n=1 Tax=Mesoplasma melaleucae TaxID=81459 RepID=A0A2K8NXQ8_9MOLU|nr:hypothetical protein [Mesoplasma melaleucae]ATZ18336.1 hypothetical protein EMELA_v1c08520 [Mesoplasma melaleucae]
MPIARRPVDKERSTKDTLKIIVTSEDSDILRSFNVPKKFVTDKNNEKDYFYIWIPKKDFTQWSYSYIWEKVQYKQLACKAIGFNHLVELMNICPHFTRKLISAIKNGLKTIKDKAAQQIRKIIKMQKEFNEIELKVSKVNLELYQLVTKTFLDKQGKDKESPPKEVKNEFIMEENIDIEW